MLNMGMLFINNETFFPNKNDDPYFKNLLFYQSK